MFCYVIIVKLWFSCRRLLWFFRFWCLVFFINCVSLCFILLVCLYGCRFVVLLDCVIWWWFLMIVFWFLNGCLWIRLIVVCGWGEGWYVWLISVCSGWYMCVGVGIENEVFFVVEYFGCVFVLLGSGIGMDVF